jgi:hypothetical protein
VLLTPDPEAAVDRTVYSSVWLEPAACHRVVHSVHDDARLALDGRPYEGPPPGTGVRPLAPGTALDQAELVALHAAADEFDIAALSAPQVLDGYGVSVDLGADGLVAVEVGGEEGVPIVLRDVPWAQGGCVASRVRWFPPDLEDANRERPSHAHVVARRHAAEVVARIAQAIWAASGGEIADEADFLLDPNDV